MRWMMIFSFGAITVSATAREVVVTQSPANDRTRRLEVIGANVAFNL